MPNLINKQPNLYLYIWKTVVQFQKVFMIALVPQIEKIDNEGEDLEV